MDVSLFVQFLRPFQWSSLWDLSRGLTSICWSIYMMCLRRRRGVDPVILSPLVKGESCRMRHHAPQSDYLPSPGWNCSPFGLSTIVLWPLCQVLPCKSLTRKTNTYPFILFVCRLCLPRQKLGHRPLIWPTSVPPWKKMSWRVPMRQSLRRRNSSLMDDLTKESHLKDGAIFKA